MGSDEGERLSAIKINFSKKQPERMQATILKSTNSNKEDQNSGREINR